MTAVEFEVQVDAVIEQQFAGYRATAARRGRNQRWPWVPVIRRPDERFGTASTQVLNRAFATRDDAVAFADVVIGRYRTDMRRRLLHPGHRSERESYGLPREIEVIAS